MSKHTSERRPIEVQTPARADPTNQERLERLVAGRQACIAMATPDERYALELVSSTVLRTGHRLLVWSATEGVRDGLVDEGVTVSGTEHAAAALYHFAHHTDGQTLCVAVDLADHLDDARTLRALRDVIAAFRDTDRCLVMIDHREELPGAIAADTVRLELAMPTERQLRRIIRRTLKRLNKLEPIEARMSSSEFDMVVRNLRGLPRMQVEQIIASCVADDAVFDAEDIPHILAQKRQRLQHDGLLEYVEVPEDLSEIGGLGTLKGWLEARRGALSDDARSFGLPAPRGILLLGVQGAGKSLCAKATAAAWQRPLLRLDPGVLYDRYVGESETRLRRTLHQAEMMAPIILWIDEIEKGFASAASQSNDGGLSQRMFGTLLTWMQDRQAPVFILATANNIEALPPELLRKGRFDEIFFVDLPSRAVRRRIIEIHVTRRGRDPDTLDLDALADAADGYSGAEIEQAIVAALHEAYAQGAELSTPLVREALANSPPISVTMAEKIQALRRWAQGRCVPAD
ncbi:MAG: AAA family ATPase [Planctomycetota bacterium]